MTPNPTLNNPYELPLSHYWTNPLGELDYDRIEHGRRLFVPGLQSIPIAQQSQEEMFSMEEEHADCAQHLVNRLRRELATWRFEGYPQTTRITRELLHFWFANPERDASRRLFFARQEAIETAIWLNEVAEKSNPGTFALRELADANIAHSAGLPRQAFKMATGTGKTVVMAALIVYHFFNRQEYRNDTRFADNFLIVSPGVTIRDRLGVLRVNPRQDASSPDYYTQRYLVPPGEGWRKLLTQLNHRIVLVNYHAFMPRQLSGNKKSPFDGKVGPDGSKTEAREDFSQVIRRLMTHFRPGSRLLVVNDEAHHCYLPLEDNRKAEGEDAKEENERAAVWFTGLRRIAQKFQLRSIYDLSATPYYLTGSGHEPYSLYPWIVSDFGLIEAIESGLVKIPFLPLLDESQELDMPILRNLYEHVKTDLPRAGQKRQRARAKEQGETLAESPPLLPPLLKVSLDAFYRHYADEFHHRTTASTARRAGQLELTDTPPVFIVVCNNTSVSKEVFKHIAGYEKAPATDGHPALIAPGLFDLFTNFDPHTHQPFDKPRTILIDSDALENSGMVNDDYKKVFAAEITQYTREYAQVHGAAAADQVTDAEILREVVNTVGRPGTLGAHVRCVVSVSMLTEGWDANTVTQIVGVRAFGSQLLCEQVAGRALRRRSYQLSPYDESGAILDPAEARRRRKGVTWKFPPEYAHIIGVPFKFFKGGKSVVVPPENTVAVRPLADGAGHCEIIFPQVEGYRVEYDPGPLQYSFDGLEDYTIDGSKLPTNTVMGTAVSGEKVKLPVTEVLARRDQEIVYRITKDLLRDNFSTEPGNLEIGRFHELRAMVSEWYERKIRVLGKGPEWKKLVYFHDPRTLVAHVARALPATHPDGTTRLRPILNYYNPTSSTRFVRGLTTREVYPTRFSHINVVVIDSGWEGKAAKTLDDLVDETAGKPTGWRIECWVKNAFLDFRIPYTDKEGKERHYLPDFLVHAVTAAGEPITLIIEVTGKSRDKPEKTWPLTQRWLPAVNASPTRPGGRRWDFLSLESEEAVADLRNLLAAKLDLICFEKRQGS